MVMGVVETIVVVVVAGVVANYVRKPSKKTSAVLGPTPMKPRPVQADIPLDKARVLLVAGLTSITDHGGWRISRQDSNTLAAELEYWQVFGGNYGSDRQRIALQFQAQLRSIGQQTEISWQYEKDHLALSATPRASLTGGFDSTDALFDRTNAAILAKLGKL